MQLVAVITATPTITEAELPDSSNNPQANETL